MLRPEAWESGQGCETISPLLYRNKLCLVIVMGPHTGGPGEGAW